MKIRIEQPQLVNMLGAMATLVDEATIEVDANGLNFRGMDPSHIALINIVYPKDTFAEFEQESKVTFGVRVDEANKIAKRFKGEVELSITNDAHLLMKGDGKSYKLRLIEASASSTPLSKLNLDVKAEMPREDLDKILSDVQVVSEYVRFEVIAGGLGVFGQGDSGEVSLVPGITTDSDTTKEHKATYSLDYLVKVVKAIKTDKPVKLEYSSKMPLRLSFEDGRIQYFLAPRVQE